MKMQAILLDRDGVINRERADYVKRWSEFEFLPGVLSALRTLATLAVPILVVSNQSAIGRGLVSLATMNEIHRRTCQMIQNEGGRIDGFFICPHRPDEECDCRKPKPGLLLQAATAFDLRLAECIFVGDSITDYQAALAAGCQSILVKSGHQGPQLHDLLDANASVEIVKDLASAVRLIMTQ